MTRLPWKRFWVRRGESWVDDDGFLFDPESEHALFAGNVPLEITQIRPLPVVVFLGEAGIGKSDVLHGEAEYTQQQVIAGAGGCLFRDLNEYGAEDRLIRDVFESDEFRAYQSGEETLHLILDSFDECRLGIPHLSRILAAELKRRVIDPERLFLRVACRSADWPSVLERTLCDVWSDDQGSKVGVFELCPLRKRDVELKAQAVGADGAVFLDAVLRREVGTLASRPKTLGFLLAEFMRHGDLPQRKVELYERGCFHLCEENPERIAAGRGGKLSAQRRLRVAARIAAALIFSNRMGLWLGSNLQQPDSDLSLEELVGRDRDDAGEFSIDREALRETLLVGSMFRQRGAERVHFEHQTDAEFLAAWYVVKCGMVAEQILALLRHPEDGHVVPQLYATAAWLAALDQKIFSELSHVEPEILLASDIAAADVELRRALVARLLAIHDDARYAERLDHSKLHKLAYPGMADQLVGCIANRAAQEQARRLAIDIAYACHVPDLQDTLLPIALDKDEPYLVRAAAAEAVGEIGDGGAKRQLLPLAGEDMEHDPDDRLKGVALSSLWPEHITSAELFAALSDPNNRNFIGTYSLFVRRELPKTLRPIHLVDALQWVETKPPSHELDFMFKDLVPEIMRLAWESLDAPGVLPNFARVALGLLRQHEPLFTRRGRDDNEDVLADTVKRHMLIREMLPLVDKQNTHILAWKIARPEDSAWLLQRFDETVDLSEREKVAEVIGGTIRWSIPTDVINLLLDACGIDAVNADPALRSSLKWLVEPWWLDADWVKEARENWSLQETRKEKRKRKPLRPSASKRVAATLRLVEAGNIEAWSSLAMELTLEDTSTHYGFPHKLHEQPGWLNADDATRKQILWAGIRFLQSSIPDSEALFGTNTHTAGQFGGGFAFELLLAVAPAVLEGLDSDNFAKWAPLIVIYHFGGHEITEKLFSLTNSKAPEAFRAAILRRTLDRVQRQPDALFLHDIDNVWSEELAQDMLGFLRGTSLAKLAHDAILDSLLRHESQEAISHAVHLHEQGNADQRCTAAVLLLMWDTPRREAWLDQILKSEKEFRCAVLMRLAGRLQYEENYSLVLSENAQADLYIALEREFSHKDDPKHEGAHKVSTRDYIVRFRDGLINRLAEQGTIAARCAIERIVTTFPEYSWLHYWLERARTATRRGTWKPASVPELIAMAEDRSARLVRSETELLEAVASSLRKLQEALLGETPIAPFLWNEAVGDKMATPKAEPRLSDFVKHHLRQYLNRRGVVVNREVEVHNWPGKGRGRSPDILVQAQLLDGETLTVVVEVKGCWNDELMTAMESQLRQKYLLGSNHRCGLYLVGWFGVGHCRRNKHSVVELERILGEQAVGLSRDGIVIRSHVLDIQMIMPC